MPRLPLPRCLLALLLLPLAVFFTISLHADLPADPPKSAFHVETIPFTAEDVAGLLKYYPLGWRYHFSQNVYARLKVWDLPVQADRPEDADKTQPPTAIYPLQEAVNDVSLSILRREEDADDHGRRLDPQAVTYKVTLQGRNVEDPSSERRRDEREVREAFSNVLTQENRGFGNNFVQVGLRQEFKEGSELIALPSSQEGCSVPFPNKELFAKLTEGLSKPGGRERLAEEKAKWQEAVERRQLAAPLVVYRRVTRMAVSGNQSQTRGRALLTLSLEFSRTPFEDNDAFREDAKPKSPAPSPGR